MCVCAAMSAGGDRDSAAFGPAVVEPEPEPDDGSGGSDRLVVDEDAGK